MPSLPPAQCSEPRCKAPSVPHSRFCKDHAPKPKAAPSRADLSAYKSTAWSTIRARQLSAQPLCAGCLESGIVRAANTVDHVFPWRRIGPFAFLQNRWQSLCPECHSLKTAAEHDGRCIEYGHKVWTLADYYVADIE